MILFRQKVPAVVVLLEPGTAALPSTGWWTYLDPDERPVIRPPTTTSGVQLDYAYPDAATDLNRWLPLVKWLLAFPHYIVLVFLDIAAFFVGDRGLVRDLVHRSLSPWHIQLRRRLCSAGTTGSLAYAFVPGHRSVPAVQAGAMTWPLWLHTGWHGVAGTLAPGETSAVRDAVNPLNGDHFVFTGCCRAARP